MPHDIEQQILLACQLEATARKPGNVHPAASFDDLCYDDLISSADVVAPLLAQTQQMGVGQTILAAVQSTREQVGGNSNLGIILLLTPLAAVPREESLPAGIAGVLNSLTQEDAALVYRAIRLANPGGMGQVGTDDISTDPLGTLLEVMRLAADRDSIAMQYATGFELVLKTGVSLLADEIDFAQHWEEAVIRLHLTLMARCPDTLIARKRGTGEARQSAELASGVIAAGWPATRTGHDQLVKLDCWLREEGHARNPGTTADLVAASLFAVMRDRRVEPPPFEQIVIDC